MSGYALRANPTYIGGCFGVSGVLSFAYSGTPPLAVGPVCAVCDHDGRVSYAPPERSWWRRAHKNDLSIHAAHEKSVFDSDMPPWHKLIQQFAGVYPRYSPNMRRFWEPLTPTSVKPDRLLGGSIPHFLLVPEGKHID
jgi:hypothetical protein